MATIANAFQTKAGAFPRSQGVVMEPGTMNYCFNGAMRDNDASNRADLWAMTETCTGAPTESVLAHPNSTMGWLQRVQYTGVAGDANQDITYRYRTGAASFAAGQAVTLSCDISGVASGVVVRLRIWAENAANAELGYMGSIETLTSGLQRAFVTYPSLPATTDHVSVCILYSYIADGDAIDARFGAVNVEKDSHPTTFCSGQLPWCAWSGADYASTSARVGTTMTVPTAGNIVAAKGSIKIWFRSSSAFKTGFGCLWSAGNANTELDGWVDNAGKVRFYTNTVPRCITPAAISIDEDHCAVFEWDVSEDKTWLYVDGVLAEQDDCGAAPTLHTTMGIGYSSSLADAAHNLNGIVTEYAVYADLLTADEVAADWNLRRPTVDHGAIDAPGIYITDGKFRISSSYTGSRIEMTAEEIATWNMADKINEIDSDGISILVSTSFYDIRSYQFRTSTGTVVSRLAGYYNAGGTANVVELRANDFAGIDSAINVQAESPTGRVANVTASAYHGAAKYADLSLNVSAGEVSTIIAVIDTTPRLTINASGITVGGALVVAGAVTGVTTLTASGDIQGDEIKTDGANTDGTQRWQLGGRQPSGDFAMTGYVEIWIGGSKWLLGCATG